MDQKKIGAFLKTLRKEKGLTQEQAAEILHVSGRTISRWETGQNMPDISLLLELSKFYGVSIPEMIDGKRECESMEKEVKDSTEKLAEYAKAEKSYLLKKVQIVSIVGLTSVFLALILWWLKPVASLPVYDCILGICAGLNIGALLTMILYSTGLLAKLRERKKEKMKTVALICAVIVLLCLGASIAASF